MKLRMLEAGIVKVKMDTGCSQLTFTCSKASIEALEKDVKYILS